MNLNSINYESINDSYDPGYFSTHDIVHFDDTQTDNMSNNNTLNNLNNNDTQYDEEFHKEMLLFVYKMLDEYDNKPTDVYYIHIINPYEDKLKYKKNGNTIEIPIEIQKAAVLQWTNMKNNKSNSNVTNKKTSCDVIESSDMIDSLFQLLFCILILFVLIYMSSLFINGTIKF